jgi:predicted nuclease with TOPRIM domain
MQKNLQEIFNLIEENKHEQKTVKAIYREAFEKSTSYKEVVEKINALKEEKKKIENAIKDEFRSELNKLDAIKTELESTILIMSDLAINEMVKGNVIEIVDKYANKYEPLFTVRFKKI